MFSFTFYIQSGPCSNVRYLGHFKNLCLLAYLLFVWTTETAPRKTYRSNLFK